MFALFDWIIINVFTDYSDVISMRYSFRNFFIVF